MIDRKSTVIKSVQLRFGSSAGCQPLVFEPGPITVFVGPNNAGKSLILQEIEGAVRQGSSYRIVDQIEIDVLLREDIIQLATEQTPFLLPEHVHDDYLVGIYANNVLTDSGQSYVSFTLKNLLSDSIDAIMVHKIKRTIACASMLRLDGTTRLSLTDQKPSGDLQGRSTNHLMALFKDDIAREKIRNITSEAFNLHFVIDPTSMQNFRVRMSHRPPIDPSEEKSLDLRSVEFHRQATAIEEFSDGIKAFTGIAAAIFSANFRIILIDEPEAFLYPPLARRLGKVMAQTATSRRGNVFASTHSSEFLMGCIQSGNPVNVVRLNYRGGLASARLLASQDIHRLMRDPLLRSSGVLNALFHQGAVVCEADRDRAFYEEINERLLAINEGTRDTLFINATNKQTIRRIIAPLRQMGIPAVGIADLDIIKEADLTALLRAASVPGDLVRSWGMLKKRVLDEFSKQGVDIKKQGVIKTDKTLQEVVNNLIVSCSEYGIFIVSVGEIEQWLSYLSVTASKENWLGAIFERMGSDPQEAHYIYPVEGDVWDFIRKIATWIANPNRKGMPE